MTIDWSRPTELPRKRLYVSAHAAKRGRERCGAPGCGWRRLVLSGQAYSDTRWPGRWYVVFVTKAGCKGHAVVVDVGFRLVVRTVLVGLSEARRYLAQEDQGGRGDDRHGSDEVREVRQ